MNLQLITPHEYLKVIQGKLIWAQITKMSISGRSCLKDRTDPIFHNL